MNTSHENLYDKLNNVHASLRKEKEDAHRTKQLAEQRLQLARADREAAEKRGVETRTQLQKLKTRTVDMKASNTVVENENKQLEKEVCCSCVCACVCVRCIFLGTISFPHILPVVNLSIQYNFQHSELQSKKEKLARLEDKRINEANSRNGSVSNAREMLRRLRDNSSSNDTTSANTSWTMSSEEMKKKLQHTMDVDGEEQLLRTLPELVKIHKSHKVEEVKDLEMKNASMRRIIAGYQNLLGVESLGLTSGQERSLVLQQ